MGEHTNIEWTDHTWSPWLGCRKVSEGCANCYIVTTTPFRTRKLLHGGERVELSVAYWKQPLRWNRQAEREGVRIKVFPSLCDWLDDEVPVAWLATFLDLIRRTPNLDWQLLTKRPQNWSDRVGAAMLHLDKDVPRMDYADQAEFMRLQQTGQLTEAFLARFRRTDTALMIGNWLEAAFRPGHADARAPGNVWVGVSVENQARADERRELLHAIPAPVRFVSYEPALGPVVWTGWEWLNWLISGGESGASARPSHPQWHRDARDFCQEHGIGYFFKQCGEWGDAPFGTRIKDAHRFPESGPWAGDSFTVYRVGKHATGRLLDGRTHDEFPALTHP